ncbi:MAG: glycosyltransferase family 4 protein [Bacteroidota bacterium]
MTVGFIIPQSSAIIQGGLKVQALETAKALQELGVTVHVISPWDDLDTIPIDLFHVFGSGLETIGIMTNLKRLGKHMVLSPVFFTRRSVSTIKQARALDRILGKLGSGIQSEYSIKTTCCNLADLVLPNTQAEAQLIERGFGISSGTIQVVPNGVESRFAEATPDLFLEQYNKQDFVLSVGQFSSPRKNAITLLKAAPKFDAELVVIGSLGEGSHATQCRNLAEKAGNVTLIESLPHNSDMLASAYAAARTFILPSWYETPGIAALEAALANCSIAITRHGGTNDYFGSFAEYFDPHSAEEMIQAVNKAHKKETGDSLKTHILSLFSWQAVASQTLTHYKQLTA